MRKKESQENIYRAALFVFAKYGYRKTTMEEIAAELDMTKGNLYRYAAGKKELYRKAVAHALGNWQARVGTAIENAGPDPRRRFSVMCEKAVEYLSSDDDLRRVLIHDPDIFPLFADNDPYESINRNSVAMIREILEQGVDAGVFRTVDAGRVSEIIFLIYKMFIIRTYVHSKDEFLRDLFDETVSLFTNGLFTKPSA
ncbi:MAG: TetR/AcrR family transcriptional regulator [Deltaproteobacteria bacterium]|nr:TetR/AcrR family transcriptional regulator [Deltaproteobacteria bacterium]